MTKQLHVFFLIMIAMLIQSIAIPVLAQDPTWDGEGTSEKPYLISSQEHLAAISTQGLNKYYKLIANTTVNNWSEGIDKFAGTFDGDGYVITMNNATASLFESINAVGIVKNLGVNATISAGDEKVGGIAATNKGTIQRCYVEGTITSTAGYIGGIADNEGTIEDCYSTVSVTTTGYYAGGIAGGNFNGTILRCYATGAISSKGSAGIAGAGVSTNSIQNCIALNESITGTGARARVANGSGTLTGNYASSLIAGTWNNIGADKKDGADLADSTFIGKGAGEGAFTAWSGDIWDFGDNTNLPTLKGFKADQPVKGITRKSKIPAIATIATAEDLATFRNAVNNDSETYKGKTVKLTADITVTNWDTPISNYDDYFEYGIFKGTFDGQGHLITLTGSASLFGRIGEEGDKVGTVQNLGVKTTTNNEDSNAGGIVNANYGTIRHCYTAGTINAQNAGGIAMSNYNLIQDCYSTATVTGKTDGSGIASENAGTIQRCYATGIVKGNVANSTAAGGIAGMNAPSSKVESCIALNTSIEGTDGGLGRIVGFNNSGIFSGNYASPAIAGTWRNTGADKQDGADLADSTFIDQGAGEGAFTAWSGDIWEFGDNTNLPTLKGFAGDQPVKDITRKSKIPAITTIATADDLAKFRDAVNNGETYKDKTVTLTADITVTNWSESIGTSSYFKGTFDGQGHAITLTGTASLFETINEDATIENLGVKVTLTSEGMGSLTGIVDANYGMIQHCYTEGTIGNALLSGGIAVSNYKWIQDCYSTVSISENGFGGGIVCNNQGTIQRCYATGSVKATETAGGIAAMNYAESNVESCIALNTSIEGTIGNLGRIAGVSGGPLTGNYASPAIAGTWDNIGTDKKDGADLTDDNFIDTGAGASAFDGWLPAVWDFSDPDKLPKLKTTGLTDNIVIAGQGILPDRSAFLETVIEISTAAAYDAATHKSKIIRILSTGTFTIATDSAYFKKLILEEGGQVVAGKAFQCNQLLAPRTLGNWWTAYSSPVEMQAVAKEKTDFCTMTGYATAEDQGWEDTYLHEPSTSCPLTSPTLVVIDGTTDVDVTLTATATESDSLAISADVEATKGSALSTGIFVFCQNPTLKNVTIPVAYILNAENNRFERTANAVVKPFQAYMVANEATSNAVMSLRAGGIPTANESIATGNFRIWGSKGQLHVSADQASKVAIYDLSGRLIHRFTLTGERTLTLRSGIYLVQSNNITYKVSL